MGKSNTQSGQVLSQILNNVAPSYGGNLYASLHSADPGASGDQSTSEISYTGYARVAVTRDNTGAGFTTSGTTRNNAAQIQFPLCTGGSATATFLVLGSAATGTGQIHYSGPLASSLAISNNITPQFAATAVTVSEA